MCTLTLFYEPETVTKKRVLRRIVEKLTVEMVQKRIEELTTLKPIGNKGIKTSGSGISAILLAIRLLCSSVNSSAAFLLLSLDSHIVSYSYKTIFNLDFPST